MENARAEAGLVELAKDAACMKEGAQKREAAAFLDMLKNAQRRYEVSICEKERASAAPVSKAKGFNVVEADRLNKQLTLEALLDPNTVVLECSDRASFFYGVMENARAEAGLVELAKDAACMKEGAQKREEAQRKEAATFLDMLKNAQRRYDTNIDEKERVELYEGNNTAKSNQQQKDQQEQLAKPILAGTLLPTFVEEAGRGRGARRGRSCRNRGRGPNNKNNNYTNNDDVNNEINEKGNNAGTSNNNNDKNNNSWLIAAKRAI
jgi:hypothetical protein